MACYPRGRARASHDMPRISRGAYRQQPRRRPPDPRCPGPPGPARPLLIAKISRPVNQLGPRRSPSTSCPSPKSAVPPRRRTCR
eukprot:126653-Pyramimonas_sp.AAC.1